MESLFLGVPGLILVKKPARWRMGRAFVLVWEFTVRQPFVFSEIFGADEAEEPRTLSALHGVAVFPILHERKLTSGHLALLVRANTQH